MKKWAIFFLLLATFQALLAQNNLRIVVINEQRLPLRGASLQVFRDSTLLQARPSDSSGCVVFTNLSPATYRLSASIVGYAPVERIVSTGTDTIWLQLTPVAKSLEAIHIGAGRRMVEVQNDRTVLNIANSPASAGTSALELLSRSPNVSVDRMSNSIVLNGKQGAIVYINGKPARLDNQALLNYLEGLPAAQVKQIELIHTPPASFDAEGTAGVINIITQKKLADGASGSISLFGGYGQRSKYGVAAHVSGNHKHITYYSDFSVSQNNTNQDAIHRTLKRKPNDVRFLNSFGARPSGINQANLRAGVDYELSSRTSLGVLLSGYRNNWTLNAVTKSFAGQPGADTNRSVLNSGETNRWHHGLVNLHGQYKTDSLSTLRFDAEYLYFFGWNPTDYLDRGFNFNQQPTYTSPFRSRKETPIHFLIGRLDYSKRWGKGWQAELGVKTTRSRFRNWVEVAFQRNGIWEQSNRFSSDFTMQETINALYASFEKKFADKATLKAGVRMEHADTELKNQLGQKVVDRNILNLFPTFSFVQKLSTAKTIQFSYTERITRPAFFAMAPAFFFFSPTNVLTGNPLLRPATTRQLTSGYQVKDLSFSLQYTHEKNSSLLQPLAEDDFVALRFENIQSQHSLMMATNYNLRQGLWSAQSNLSFFLQNVSSRPKDVLIRQSTHYLQFNTTHNFRLPKNLQLEWNGQMNTARNLGLAKMPMQFLMSAGVQKSWGPNKLVLNVYDIANLGSFWRIDFNQPSLDLLYNFNYDYEGNIFRLTYTFQFGKSQKAQGIASTASEDEVKRVN